MEWARSFIFLIIALITSSLAEYKQTSNSSQGDTNEKKARNPRISSEFGYSIQNSDRLSNQFRQEHRDVNGVVRGSYGFKNPNGAFRLVQYVADGKGFRAHISSNEHGVGKQNPASVSVNRFDHQPGNGEDRKFFKAPISPLRKHSPLRKSEAQLLGHELYPPVQTIGRVNLNSNFELPFTDDSNAYDIGNHEFQPVHRQNPVDKLIKTRFGIPGEIVSSLRENERDDIRQTSQYLESGPFTKTSPQRGVTHQYNVYPLTNPMDKTLLSDNNYQDITLKTNGNKQQVSSYPPFLANLLHRPRHKVHTSLPDCNMVSSAVLCKPPVSYSRSISQQKKSENAGYSLEEILRASASQLFEPEDKPAQDSVFSNFYDLSDHGRAKISPHLIPNSYPLRSDVYNNFLNYIQEHSKLGVHKQDCRKHDFNDAATSTDYFTPSESQEFVNDPISNDLAPHNLNGNEIPSFQNSLNDNYPDYSKDKDEEFYSSLIRIIQNDDSLNKLRNMLLQSTQTPADSSSGAESPKMSLLGVLILPSHVVKELDNKNSIKPVIKKVPVNFDEKNLSNFGDDVFDSDILDEPQYLEEDHNRHFPETNFEKDVEAEKNSTVEYDQQDNHPENKSVSLGSDLPFYLPPLLNNPQHDTINDTETPVQTIRSHKFHVFDDQEHSGRDSNKPHTISNSSSGDWRKILEDEINKEIRETALRTDISFSGEIPDGITDPEEDARPNVHRYNINKHIGPLYDSTGKLIEPDNVPIHIHRFNPPSGLASLPWKYSIPRPAPPRSIVVPPKPLIVS